MPKRVVIVGASIGGVRTAEALRAEGHRGSIVVVGAEREAPYDKPPLSKQFLAGAWETEDACLLTEQTAAKARIELRLGASATALNVARRRVELADGTQLCYDRAVIATGAAARPSPWAATSGVHVLRTLADARALRVALQREGPIVVVGAGFIGAEVAATAHAAGRDVTVVDPLAAPAAGAVGPAVARLLAGVHARRGVATRLGVGVTDVRGDAGALTVTLSDGAQLPAATVVVGIGVTLNDAWLEGSGRSGLQLDDGVVCAADGGAVGADGVYAVGDVARWWRRGRGEYARTEHWTSACEQAACVAHNLAHPGDRREHDWKIQLAGRPGRCGSHELIGDHESDPPRFAALYRDDDGALGGAVTVNWPRALAVCRRHIHAGERFATALDATVGLAERIVA
jgi:NADPH-dependent 2,4-dienoyl-CoA reductase/sulfur reductase-like enzyme